MDHRNGGLFMVFDKNGNNIPAVLGAAYYFYSKTKAIEYAMTIWRAGGSSGTIPVVYVQPGQEEERVFVDNSWIPSQSLSASIYRIPWNLLTFALSALEGLMEATTGEIRSGLFRVINPGMGIPGVHHAMYWYTEAESHCVCDPNMERRFPDGRAASRLCATRGKDEAYLRRLRPATRRNTSSIRDSKTI